MNVHVLKAATEPEHPLNLGRTVPIVDPDSRGTYRNHVHQYVYVINVIVSTHLPVHRRTSTIVQSTNVRCDEENQSLAPLPCVPNIMIYSLVAYLVTTQVLRRNVLAECQKRGLQLTVWPPCHAITPAQEPEPEPDEGVGDGDAVTVVWEPQLVQVVVAVGELDAVMLPPVRAAFTPRSYLPLADRSMVNTTLSMNQNHARLTISLRRVP